MLAMIDNLSLASLPPSSFLAKGILDGRSMTSVVLFFAAGMIVFWVLFRARHRRRARGRAPGGKLRPAADSRTGPLQAPPPDLDRWSVEMHETARDLSAQIDTKMVALQSLIRAAEAKEAELKRLIEEAEKKQA